MCLVEHTHNDGTPSWFVEFYCFFFLLDIFVYILYEFNKEKKLRTDQSFMDYEDHPYHEGAISSAVFEALMVL